MLYFSVPELGADGGVMITGSHNPPDYNGFKMMLKDRPFFGADIRALGEAAAREFVGAGWRVIGTGRRAERLDAIKAELGDAFHAAAFDVTDEAARDAALDEVKARTAAVEAITRLRIDSHTLWMHHEAHPS